MGFSVAFATARCLFVTQKVTCPSRGELKKFATHFFMGDLKKLTGRPRLNEGKRTKWVNVRFTDEEYKEITELEQELGKTKTELIRMRVLTDTKKTVVNSKELIRYLDSAGAEMGRVGNNINQLAKYANTLRLKGRLDPSVASEFNLLFKEYILVQKQLEAALRKIIRAMGN